MTRVATFLAVMAVAGSAQAADHVVDGDASTCPAAGTEDDPYPTLQCAIDNAALAPGDRIVLRDAASAYDGATTSGAASGTEGSPIVIEPAFGAGPRLSGGLVLEGVDHWVARDLVLEGGSGTSVALRGGTGLTAEGLQILDWDGPGIVVGTTGSAAPDARIVGNRIEGVAQRGIYAENCAGARFIDNDISAVQCVAVSFSICTACGDDQCFGCGDCLGVSEPECTAMQSYDIGGRLGIRLLAGTTDVEVAGNYIHDFDSASCGVDNQRNMGMWITSTSAGPGSIHHNYIRNVGAEEYGYGVLMYQSAPGWTIERNVVEGVSECALCEGDFLFFGGSSTQWRHNTIVDAGIGLEVEAAIDATFERNLVVAPRTASVRVGPDGVDAPPGFSGNVYDDGMDVGVWGDAASDLPGWQSACGCDDDARAGTPGFFGDGDFTPAPDGPAADVGGGDDPFHGTGPDAGALEAALLVSAEITAAEPDRIALTVDNRVAPPLVGAEACAGIEVTADDAPVPLAGCTAAADDRITVTLLDPVSGDSVVTVRHEGATIVDSSRIGGRIGARLAAGELSVQNRAPPGPVPGGSDDGVTSMGDGTGGDDVGGDGADDGEDGAGGGCACALSRRWGSAHALPATLLLLLVSRPRRRAR